MKMIYDALLSAIRHAALAADVTIVDGLIVDHGLTQVAPVDAKFMTAHAVSDGTRTVLIQYRYYDTSQAFSVQPDMNVYLLKLLRSVEIEQQEEIRFLDKSVYG